jgi:enamine deaminase RidA (YjgF/YER057c/UK114 family)
MRKQIIDPETGEWAKYETAYSDGIVVHMPEGKRVFLSGIVADGDNIEKQTQAILEQIAETLADFGGEMKDIVRVRLYIAQPVMNEETLEIVHEIRNEFFDQDQLPASTLVEVADLVEDEFLIEIDSDAFIPDEGWDVETV